MNYNENDVKLLNELNVIRDELQEVLKLIEKCNKDLESAFDTSDLEKATNEYLDKI